MSVAGVGQVLVRGTAARFRRRGEERGVVAILIALSMVALVVAGAFVMDLSRARLDGQENQSAADAAALAGVNGLIPDANSTTVHPFAGVCTALHYYEANNSGSFSSAVWSDATGAPAADGCTSATAQAATCTANDPSTWARFTGVSADGRTTVRIQSGYLVNTGDFGEDSLPALTGDTGSMGGCDQLAVIIGQTRPTTLGSIATAQMSSIVRSVGRVTITPPQSPFALLILERHDCDALFNDSGGAGGRIDVLGYQDHPGMIHVDSDGTGAQCNAKPIIEGKNPGICPDPAAPAPTTCGGIVAHEAPIGGAPGKITVVGTSNTSDGTPQVYAGPYPGTDPTHRDQETREVVDNVYLQGVTDAVNNEAKPAFAAAASGTAPSGYTSYGCPGAATTYPDTKIFIKCSSVNNNVSFPNATDVIFTGQVSAAQVLMPVAQHVYVAGSTQPNGAAISVGTTFGMHDYGSSTCPTTFTPSAGRARLFIAAGALKTAGGSLFRACNTTVILMGNDSTGGACLPSLTPYVATYTNTPCPGGKTGNGSLQMSGNGTIEWTAPDLDDDDVQATAADHHDLEDLALWDESYGVQNLGGGGYMHLAGCFSAPNADPFTLNGGPTQNVRNSQYVVRKLRTTGSGTLSMQPLPSLPVAPPEITFELVR